MLLKEIDYLSPKVTLFYYGKRGHTSILGGVLVIMLVIIGSTYSILRIYSLANHRKSTSAFYKKYKWEAGKLNINETSLFNFFQVQSTENGGIFVKFETKYIRFVLSYVHSSFSEEKLKTEDHWVYDLCREGIDNKDLNKSIFQNVVNFTNAVCIRYYYNSKLKKYINKEDKKNFKWPSLEHGISRSDNIFLNSFLLTCHNNTIMNTILGDCGTQEEINDYVDKIFGLYFYFLDYQIDPTNYKNPTEKYFQVASCAKGGKTYVGHYLHFTSLSLKTTQGIFSHKKSEINLFNYDFNRKSTEENNSDMSILTKVLFLLQNTEQIYTREYENLFNLMSNLGGTLQFLYYIFFLLNYIYNRYVRILNTNSLLFDIKGGFETNEEKRKVRNVFIQKYQDVILERGSLVFPKLYTKSQYKNSVSERINIRDLKSKNNYRRNSISNLSNNKNLVIFEDNDDITEENNSNLMNLKKISKITLDNKPEDIGSELNIIEAIKKYDNKDIIYKKINQSNIMSRGIKDKLSLNFTLLSDEKDNQNIRSLDSSQDENINSKLRLNNLNPKSDNNLKLLNINKINSNLNQVLSSSNKVMISNGYNNRKLNLLKKVENNNYNDNALKKDIKQKKNFSTVVSDLSNFKQQIIKKKSQSEKKTVSVFKKSNKNLRGFSRTNDKTNNTKADFIFNEDNTLIKGNFNLLTYIFGQCNKFNNVIFVLDNFRKKLLSEEHLFRTHINVYLLEKNFKLEENEKTDLVELYLNL